MKTFKIEAAILGFSLIVLGMFLASGLNNIAADKRIVSVRGLAEREVKADFAIWPVVYKTTGNNLQSIYTDVQKANVGIMSFLTKNGIDKDEISESELKIADKQADRYSSDRSGDRYTVTSVITVATTKVELVRQLLTQVGELLKEGIAISAGDYDTRVQYEFKSLNQIKPEMIEEATRNAREAAEKFAADSGSELGKIQTANQGLFSIDDRDNYTPYIKHIRVVTSVNYYLEN
ncbi:MAG: SIMPL domain-containing protein [Bacteroidaceae bacterium]|nr:SIMPL domain-containing protein [Bacteroidaceae bacterium]